MSEVNSKACTQCGTSYPATPEYFHRIKAGRYGLHSWCKACKCSYQNALRLKNTIKELGIDGGVK